MSKIQAGDYVYFADEFVRNRDYMHRYPSAGMARTQNKNLTNVQKPHSFLAQNGRYRIIALYTNSHYPQKINGPASYNQIGAIAINNGSGGNNTWCYLNKLALNWNRTVANSSYKPPQKPVVATNQYTPPRTTTRTVGNTPIIRHWNANSKSWVYANAIRKWDGKRWTPATIKKWDANRKSWDKTITTTYQPPKTVVKKPQYETDYITFRATWSQQYQGNNTQKNWTDPKQGSNGSVMHQGYCDPASMWGIQKSMFGFNWQEIQRLLKGATIDKVELKIANRHFWYNKGGRVRIGAHNSSGHPGSFQETQHGISDQYFNYGQARWITLPKRIGEQFRDGSVKGFTLYCNTYDLNYYGYFHGAGSSNVDLRPHIKITYTKRIS